jgi:hypothetical protein
MRGADWVVTSGWVLGTKRLVMDQPAHEAKRCLDMRPYHTICLSFSDSIYNYLPFIQPTPGVLLVLLFSLSVVNHALTRSHSQTPPVPNLASGN